MVGSLSFVFLDLSIGEILNFAVGGDSATRIDSNIDCLSTGSRGLVPLVGREGWLVIRSLSKLLSFVYTPGHTTGTTQGRVVGEQLSSNTSFRFGQLLPCYLLGEEVNTHAVIQEERVGFLLDAEKEICNGERGKESFQLRKIFGDPASQF